MTMTHRRTLRVLHAPSTVGGNPPGLAAAERELGLDSVSWTQSQNYLAYPADRVIATHGPFIGEFQRWLAVCQMLRFDIVHFNFGSSLMPQMTPAESSRRPWLRAICNGLYASWSQLLDVRLAHRWGIPIFVTYQGDDARQGDFCRREFPIHFAHEVDPGYYTNQGDRWKRARIATFARLADGIFAVNPDLLKVLPAGAEFIPYASVDPAKVVPFERGPLSSEPLVVHAPSHRGVKGTSYILAAVERLHSEGIPFRFRLIEGLSNAEALRAYASADLLVDQLLAGWYGGLAVEAMALGVPVIAYLRHSDFAPVPQQMREELPVIGADPNSIVDVMRAMLTVRRHELRDLGERGRRYVQRWHDPRRIAGIMRERYLAALERRAGVRVRQGAG